MSGELGGSLVATDDDKRQVPVVFGWFWCVVVVLYWFFGGIFFVFWVLFGFREQTHRRGGGSLVRGRIKRRGMNCQP